MKKVTQLLSIISILMILNSCSSTNIYENQEIILSQNNTVLSSQKTTIKDGKAKSNKNKSKKNKSKNNLIPENDDGQVKITKVDEKVTVKSTPNKEYITYSIFGKPFVILGCSIWELLKCGGYSFVNFIGGYNTANGGKTPWIKPDVKGNFKKCNEALEANKIKVYPEYHKPFTDNTIEVSKITYTAETYTLDEDEMQVSSKEEYEYDNTLSVKKSVTADANATFGVMGVVGSIITVPISACTWLLGVIYGVAEKVK